jgi:hypothetical protein
MTDNWKNIEYCFSSHGMQEKIKRDLQVAKLHPLGIDDVNGIQIHTVFYMDQETSKMSFLNSSNFVHRNMDGSSRLMVFILAFKPLIIENQVIGQPDYLMRIDIPLHLAYDKELIEQYALYHIRFKINEDNQRFTEKTSEPLRRGYIGITKRGFMTRFMEHKKKAVANTGFLFHSVWNSLLQEKIPMYPVVQVCGSAETLKEIYTLEESAVERFTLTPLGLNAIPGGMAGIRLMHKLRLLNSLKVGIDERDAAIEKLQRGNFAHGSPCAHYRKGHVRKLTNDKLTYVSPCWVNLKEVESQT